MKNYKITTKVLTSCALLTALSILLARIFSLMPNTYSRFSLESIPIILSGILFGPVCGALVGAASDFIGCLFSPYGYNPLFALPPILYGLSGGLFSPWLKRGVSYIKLLVTVGTPALFGSVIWQTTVLDLVYNTGYLVLLPTRAAQFLAVAFLDAAVIRLLFHSNMFYILGLWREKYDHKRST